MFNIVCKRSHMHRQPLELTLPPCCTFLQRCGQPQLPQLWLHGVGELLQGPRVQAHPVRRLVPSTGKVQLPELGEPPGTQMGNELQLEEHPWAETGTEAQPALGSGVI